MDVGKFQAVDKREAVRESEGACDLVCGCGSFAKMECLICARVGVKPVPTFCCPDCYKEHWKTHRAAALASQHGRACYDRPRVQIPNPMMGPMVGPIYRNHHMYRHSALRLWQLQNIADPVPK